MVRFFAILIFLAILVIPSQATVVLFSQNFEGGVLPGQFTSSSTLLNTSGVPGSVGDGNWALWDGGSAASTAAGPVGFQLTGLTPFQQASIEFTFIALDTWDGIDNGPFSPDFFNVQVNADVLFQASFRNTIETHYTGDGSAVYGSTMPPNSTITLLSSDISYLALLPPDSFYDIKLDGFHADASGNLAVYFYPNGAGWQGGDDEGFAIDNLLLTSPDQMEVPEPGTWILSAAGFAMLLARRFRK